MGCNGGCSGCTGCAGRSGVLTLTPQEAQVLLRLAETPFLPIARCPDWESPAFREAPGDDGVVLVILERKGLVSLDYDMPLTNYDYAAYADCTIFGSVALTARGQTAVDLLEGGRVEDA